MNVFRKVPVLIGTAVIVAVILMTRQNPPHNGEDVGEARAPQHLRDSTLDSQRPHDKPPIHTAANPDWSSLPANRSATTTTAHVTSDPAPEPAEIAAFVAEALSGPDPQGRLMALHQLRALAGRSVSAELQQALVDPDVEVRVAALEELALDRLEWADDDDTELLNALSIAMNDPAPDVRIVALRLASESGTESGLALEQRGLGDADDEVRRWAALLLASSDSSGEPVANN
jgi:HEAT repeat protein